MVKAALENLFIRGKKKEKKSVDVDHLDEFKVGFLNSGLQSLLGVTTDGCVVRMNEQCGVPSSLSDRMNL